MKGIQYKQFGGPEVLQLVELPDPHPGPGQVRVAVRAVAVNPIDWKVRSGMMGGELPQTTGREAAGVVDELGEGVQGVAVGDRAFGFVSGAGAAELAVLGDYAPTERAVHGLTDVGPLIESGRFSLPVAQTFPLERIGDAQALSQEGHVRGKLVVLVG